MLYRTHHHAFFSPLNPFTSPSSISPHPFPSSTTILPSVYPSPQIEQGMESVYGALKSSFKPDMAMKSTTTTTTTTNQQALMEDLWTVNAQQTGDDFFVDGLLDFSKAGSEDSLAHEEKEQQAEEAAEEETNTNTTTTINNNNNKCFSFYTSPKNETNSNPSTTTFSLKDDTELSLLPAEDVKNLEWLSHFVEDSFSGYSLTYPDGKLPPNPSHKRSENEAPVQTKPCFTTPVQTKARTKRFRTGSRVWSLGSPSLTESSTSSSSSSSSTTSSLRPNPWLIFTSQGQTADSLLLGKPPAKKYKKKPVVENSGCGGSGGSQQPRRCSHCGVQKTPQWRAGPLGAKTLCNACGVRFKSGRLLPEYRPACSPTFSSEVHSNNHRKVLEMRRKKEVETGLVAPPVQSF